MVSKERPFSWGIVGAGAIARQFASDLGMLPDARIGAIHSRTERAARDFAVAAGVAAVHPTLDALLADPSVDAVYIASPNASHASHAIAALEAGKPVLIEKPIAIASADASAIAAAAAACDRFAMEAMWSRFLPAVQAARALLRQGAIGAITGIEGELAYRQEEKTGSRFFDPALGGGASLDLGVYPLSLAVHFLGLPTAVGGHWWPARTGVDLRAEFHLEFGAAKGVLSCGFDTDGRNHLTVFGSKGALRLHAPFLKAQRLTLYREGMRDLPLVGAKADELGLVGKLLARLPLPGRHIERYAFSGNGLQFEANAVMELVRGGATQSDVMPLPESAEVLRIIETVLALPPERNPRS